ncbi:hypothetical protein V8C86DRAFT_3144587, partial [Haematococcus lacustris]
MLSSCVTAIPTDSAHFTLRPSPHLSHNATTSMNCSNQLRAPQPAPVCCTDTTYAGCLSSRLGISEARAAWLVSCWPSLVSHPLPLVHAAVRTVCAVFECTTPQAMEAMVKEQRLLLHTRPQDIRGQLRQLAAALGMEAAALRPVVRRAPSVLYEEPMAVQTRLAQVAHLLGAPLSRILHLLTQQQPLLLVASPDTIQEQLTAQSHLLGLSPAGAKALQLKHPHMLLLSPTALNAKLQQLKTVLGLSSRAAQDLVRAYPRLLQLSVTRIAQQALDLHSLLPQAHLAALAAQEPSLLYRPAANAKASLHQLQQLLRCSPADAAALAVRRPALLTKSPSALTASFRALSPWQLSQEQKSELLTAHPVLLRLAPTEVHLRCRWLRRVMLHSALLHSQLRELRMPLLGVLLMHLPGTWSRLEFVGRRAEGRPLDVLWVVESGDQAFEAVCPGHAAWRAWRQQQLRGCRPWRVPPAPLMPGGPASVNPLGHACLTPGSPGKPGWPSAAPPPSSGRRPVRMRVVVHEAHAVRLGGSLLSKPRRQETVSEAAAPAVESHLGRRGAELKRGGTGVGEPFALASPRLHTGQAAAQPVVLDPSTQLAGQPVPFGPGTRVRQRRGASYAPGPCATMPPAPAGQHPGVWPGWPLQQPQQHQAEGLAAAPGRAPAPSPMRQPWVPVLPSCPLSPAHEKGGVGSWLPSIPVVLPWGPGPPPPPAPAAWPQPPPPPPTLPSVQLGAVQ